jgi:hypothetical protein
MVGSRVDGQQQNSQMVADLMDMDFLCRWKRRCKTKREQSSEPRERCHPPPHPTPLSPRHSPILTANPSDERFFRLYLLLRVRKLEVP